MLKVIEKAKKLSKASKAKLKDNKGEVVVDTVVNLMIVFILCIVIANILLFFIHFYSLHYTAKAVTRVIEREGGLTNEAYLLLDELNDNFHTEMEITSRIANKVQYMDSFEVTIEDSHRLTFLTPAFSDPLVYDVPMRVKMTGKSEVYWKELL